jgi:TonB-linked SusC/RagA family outer membrane protein
VGKINKPSMKLKLIIITLLFFYASSSWAQELSITGSVRSAVDNEPLIGVTIVIEGTTTGVITDYDGKFIINAQPGDLITVSYIGYEKQTIQLDNQTVLNIALNPSTEELEEVMVVGYGTQKKESVVGAITQVNSEDLVNSGVSEVTQALAGKLSGVVTIQNNGRPGDSQASILIRGKSSWVSAAPLVMVDGIERSFADIDPNEVSSISVLKDASATAVYGSRGGNGVILVTTKRGFESKPKISFTCYQGLKHATSLPTYVDAYTTLQHANIAMKNDGIFNGLISGEVLDHYRNGDEPYLYPDVDWINEMIQTGYATTANINLRGGTKSVKYFTSFGYNHDGDILRSEKLENLDPRFYSNRYNLRSNFDFDISKTTRIKVNVGASHKTQNGNSGYYGDFFRNIYQVGVNYSPLYYGADALELYPDENEPSYEGMRFAGGVGEGKNPYTILHAGLPMYDFDVHQLYNRKISTTDFNADIGFDQDLSFITEGLKVSALVSMNTSVAYQRQERQNGSSYILSENETWRRMPSLDYDLEPLYFEGHSLKANTRKLYYEAKINYARSFNNHYITAMGIFNRNERNTSLQPVYRDEAWAARATYSYALKYLFEVNLGYTGSEQFAPANRFGFFPAYAVGWNAGEEKFIKENLTFLDKLKFRYSYGKTGYDATPERWLYESEGYSTTYPAHTYAQFGPGYILRQYMYKEGKVANINAQWEESVKHNFGVETAFFERRMAFSFDIFKEERDKILMLPGSIPGFTMVTFKPLNLGRTKNHGFEFELSYRDETEWELKYSASANFSFSENRVVFQDDPLSIPDYQKNAGFPIGTQRHYLQDELYQSVDDVVNYLYKTPNVGLGDVRFVDYNADGVINDKDQVAYEGTQYPLYSFGLSLNTSYKGFSINALLQGMLDKKSYFNNIAADPFYGGYNRIYAYQLNDYWTTENPDAFYPATHYDVARKSGNNDLSYAQRYLNTSFIRLKELQLAYTLKPEWNKFPVDHFMIYISGNNLLTWSEFGELGDPEKTSFTPGAGNSYPLLRRYNIGVKVNF